ncbi:MAG: glycosyltransferase family 9 protein [Nitrospirota bacterium]
MAVRRRDKKFLVAWNRGFGDIPLGLYAFVDRVKQYIPEAEITFLTRPELEEAFRLLEGVEVIVVPSWKRKDGTPTIPVIKETLKTMGIDYKYYDVILDKVDPTGELRDYWGKLIPRLKWKDEYDNLWKRFNLQDSSFYIAAHVNTETQQFYGYKKDWPVDSWKMLFEKLSEKSDTKIILFGHSKTDSFNLSSIIDLRGKTSLLEMLSIIKNCCDILIAPDGGVLSITYYIDVYFPITVISLWGDANQGIMKQAIPSPNIELKHIPIIGKGKDISKISVDEVYNTLSNYLIALSIFLLKVFQ